MRSQYQKDVESAEEHGLDETELDYYTSVLAE